jgi:hypothetical protein
MAMKNKNSKHKKQKKNKNKSRHALGLRAVGARDVRGALLQGRVHDFGARDFPEKGRPSAEPERVANGGCGLGTAYAKISPEKEKKKKK